MKNYTSVMNKWHDRHPDRSWDDLEEWLLLGGLLVAIVVMAAVQWRLFQKEPRQRLGSKQAGPDPRALPKARPHRGQKDDDDDDDKPAEPTEADRVFHGEKAEDVVFKDDQLGYLYRHEPADADDLTKIKGVGEVLAGRLNEWGVFTFKQIALWDQAMISEFGQRLAFHERILRDDWVGQARELWKDK